MCDFMDCEKWKELSRSQNRAFIFLKPTCYRPLKANNEPVGEVSCSAGLSGELYAYCDDCKTTKLMIEDPLGESYDGKFIGGDISCECGKIVATLYRRAR